jgi:hypothetical protein
MGASSVRKWVKHFKDRNTDIGDKPRCGRPRTAATECKKQKVDELIRKRPKDNSQRNCSATWSGASCGPGDDGDFEISESLFPFGSPFRNTERYAEIFYHNCFDGMLSKAMYFCSTT